jgi:ubiquinone/menaquinone biosynthesis C-methylase UbiE
MRIPKRALETPVLLTVLVMAGCHAESASAAEIDRIAEVLPVRKGMKVADVGAGEGEWSVAIAELVGEGGRVFATEVDESELRKIEREVKRSGFSNITTVLGDQADSGLPDDCCDAILLRMVFHHFVDPAAMLGSLRKALVPGGHLAVIDITPQGHWRDLEGVPERGGHGISLDDLISEISEQGFELLARYDDWNDDPDRYCVVFRSRSLPNR